MAIPNDKARIIDADLNRIAEGRRFIEKFARQLPPVHSIRGCSARTPDEAGAISVAHISAVMNSNDIEEAKRQPVKIVEGVHNGQT